MFRGYRWIGFTILCLVLGALALAGFLRPLGDGFRRLTLPMVRKLTLVFRPLSSNPYECKELEDRMRRFAADRARLAALEEENALLRAQARFLASTGYKNLGAQVIGREVRTGRTLLLVDRGREDGVELGQAVIVGNGWYVGKISVLKDRVSVVEVMTDPEARVAAALAGKRRLIGVVEGRGNGAAALTYLPLSAGLARDQVVVTAGTEDKIPPNLPIGIVNAVTGAPTDPFYSATIEPLIHVEEIDLVSILQPSASSQKNL